MSITKLIALTASVVMFSACAPAAQQNAELSQDDTSSPPDAGHSHKATKDNLHRPTIKPGADVSIKSVLPKSMISGEFQTVKLELMEGYQEGVMTVSIEPSEGLTLFAGSNSKTFNLSNPGPHMWDLDVKADSDGVYFLNIFAQAGGQARSFSVRLNIGVGEALSKEMFDEAMPADGELTDGGKIRVLEADETIR